MKAAAKANGGPLTQAQLGCGKRRVGSAGKGHRGAGGRRPPFQPARFTRDVMSQMETDLGTKLDWVPDVR